MKQQFALFYKDRYKELEHVLMHAVSNNDRVLDIGAGDGHFEAILERVRRRCHITCVENDALIAESLIRRTKSFRHAVVQVNVEDANKFLRNRSSKKFDVIFLSSTLHELNTPAHHRAYLDLFFDRIARILQRGGILIVGDFYYPAYLSNSEVKRFMALQNKLIGHADAREKFITPDLLVAIAVKKLKCSAYEEFRATDRIDRRHYIAVFTH